VTLRAFSTAARSAGATLAGTSSGVAGFKVVPLEDSGRACVRALNDNAHEVINEGWVPGSPNYPRRNAGRSPAVFVTR
jgi:hypothetical protein